MRSRYEENKQKRRLERKKRKKLRHKKFIIFLLIIFLLLLIWGKFIEPNLLMINDYKIESETLPESFKGTKIVQFSDLHYGMISENFLKKVVDNINSLKPDVVVFTGDLVEEGYKLNDKDIKLIVKYLGNIESSLGKYAIIGNHDVRNEDFDNIMYDAHFSVLKNNYDTVYNENNDSILIYGLDDMLGGEPQIRGVKSKEINGIKCRIVLVHEPDYIDEFVNDFDTALVLSGHSHGSQVYIPGINKLYLPKGSTKYYRGHYTVNNTPLYVSNGLGTSIFKFRLFSIPSIDVYRLYTK